jgi:hypothetical protein
MLKPFDSNIVQAEGRHDERLGVDGMASPNYFPDEPEDAIT